MVRLQFNKAGSEWKIWSLYLTFNGLMDRMEMLNNTKQNVCINKYYSETCL